MDTDSFIAHIKTDDIYKDIAEDVKTRFDTSNYKLFIKTLQKMLKLDLLLQIMNEIEHCLEGKT